VSTGDRIGPLAGLVVLDLGRVLAAPWAGQILGDLGADVIKVERPTTGDDARSYGATSRTADGAERPSTMFACANRNKRSLTLDLAKPEGAMLLRRLGAKADVLIENFLPGTMARFGLDYASLAELNPRLVYCSVTGYGQNGPYRDRPGYDGVFQAESGLMEITGLPDDQPGGGPMKTGPSMIDVTMGFVSVIGILSALSHRDRVSGRGQHVDSALLDAAVVVQSSILQEYLFTGVQPERKGTEGNGGQPARIFACRDRQVYISAGHQGHYEGLCKVLALPELLDDPRFATGRLRAANRKAWAAIAEPVIARWKSEDLVRALVAAKVPCTPVNDYQSLLEDPHVRHRGATTQMVNPASTDDRLELISSPIRLSETPVTYRDPPPLLGQHSEVVLTGMLQLGPDEIDGLRRRQVI